MNLAEFKVKSFVTEAQLSATDTIRGGFTYATELNCATIYYCQTQNNCGSGGSGGPGPILMV